ncbi:gamma-aminobutyric acid receptor subunit pi-like isoform X2 [Symsagittifera roscoffensis]|uniref:gamma-aminobutyric acid receptor subunit pi-like isoform X2 n=1 Tax=Symsagittifera roscoffensis TaxID=84072 RepID=UPI00307BE622
MKFSSTVSLFLFGLLFVLCIFPCLFFSVVSAEKNKNAVSSADQSEAEEESVSKVKNSDVTDLLNFLISDEEDEYGAIRYDKTLRPLFGGEGVQVGITMNLDSLGPIDEVNMHFRVDISFRQFWRDSRLDFAQYNGPQYTHNLTLSHEFLERIWVPDTYFPDSLDASKQDVMVPNVLIRLSPDGSILYSSRVTVITKCPMELAAFPLDTQTCILRLECYGYTAEELRLFWKDGIDSVTMKRKGKDGKTVKNSSIHLAQFKMEKIVLTNQTFSFSTGSFIQLQVNFHLKRDLLFFILQSYVPSTFIVMCSWVAFWINREGIPGRACLSITTVLSLITLIGSTNAELPNVSTIKALDIYFGICFLFVFGGLFEFATVVYLAMLEKQEKAEIKAKQDKAQAYMDGLQSKREAQLMSEIADSFSVNIPHRISTTTSPTPLELSSQALSVLDEYKAMRCSMPKAKQFPSTRTVTASRIELCSRYAFPSLFLLFQLVYWGYYGFLREVSSEQSEPT